jgi:ribosomal protein S18 acetylase RimI-like enzyme
MEEGISIVEQKTKTYYRNVDGENVASVTISMYDDGGCFLTSLWVAPDQRRKGYATELMKRVVEDFKDEDLWLQAAPFDLAEPATTEWVAKFYEKLGFEKNGKYMLKEGISSGE